MKKIENAKRLLVMLSVIVSLFTLVPVLSVSAEEGEAAAVPTYDGAVYHTLDISATVGKHPIWPNTGVEHLYIYASFTDDGGYLEEDLRVMNPVPDGQSVLFSDGNKGYIGDMIAVDVEITNSKSEKIDTIDERGIDVLEAAAIDLVLHGADGRSKIAVVPLKDVPDGEELTIKISSENYPYQDMKRVIHIYNGEVTVPIEKEGEEKKTVANNADQTTTSQEQVKEEESGSLINAPVVISAVVVIGLVVYVRHRFRKSSF